MIILLISMVISFIISLIIIPYFMQFLYAGGIVGLDLHKKNKPRLPTSGGICVAFGILAGLLTYVGIKTFAYGIHEEIISILAVISSILIVMFVGFLDDLNVKAKAIITKEGLDIRIGFPQWIKPLLTLPAAIPLMVVNIGDTTMSLPIIGAIDFGILYPLLLIPIGVVGASNAVNLLGGFNGLEGGMGLIYLFSLGLYALLHGSIGSIIFLTAAAALIAFAKYNWFPAKILPGDSLTYLLGSIVACGVIVGNMEKIGIIVMIPFIIEFFLKARSKFKASCLGKLRRNGKLDAPYGNKIFSLTHIFMNLKPMTEKQVALSLIFLEIIFATIPFLGVI